ncbi:hypothetical protein IE53DRAFT_391298 [Violaceomyces palustris]|uniref:Uncharacterized protein n=1 Tax=Violaceomyces palustris TaxID=1673888 RepID=A0ACD0NLB0_9BASI|nr:hypothetical protein IE53DRAFT_391298 [Violaceomyces palustris]
MVFSCLKLDEPLQDALLSVPFRPLPSQDRSQGEGHIFKLLLDQQGNLAFLLLDPFSGAVFFEGLSKPSIRRRSQWIGPSSGSSRSDPPDLVTTVNLVALKRCLGFSTAELVEQHGDQVSIIERDSELIWILQSPPSSAHVQQASFSTTVTVSLLSSPPSPDSSFKFSFDLDPPDQVTSSSIFSTHWMRPLLGLASISLRDSVDRRAILQRSSNLIDTSASMAKEEPNRDLLELLEGENSEVLVRWSKISRGLPVVSLAHDGLSSGAKSRQSGRKSKPFLDPTPSSPFGTEEDFDPDRTIEEPTKKESIEISDTNLATSGRCDSDTSDRSDQETLLFGPIGTSYAESYSMTSRRSPHPTFSSPSSKTHGNSSPPSWKEERGKVAVEKSFEPFSSDVELSPPPRDTKIKRGYGSSLMLSSSEEEEEESLRIANPPTGGRGMGRETKKEQATSSSESTLPGRRREEEEEDVKVPTDRLTPPPPPPPPSTLQPNPSQTSPSKLREKRSRESERRTEIERIKSRGKPVPSPSADRIDSHTPSDRGRKRSRFGPRDRF